MIGGLLSVRFFSVKSLLDKSVNKWPQHLPKVNEELSLDRRELQLFEDQSFSVAAKKRNAVIGPVETEKTLPALNRSEWYHVACFSDDVLRIRSQICCNGKDGTMCTWKLAVGERSNVRPTKSCVSVRSFQAMMQAQACTRKVVVFELKVVQLYQLRLVITQENGNRW
uniref:Uncharacterized protein n=1 Tax=Tanacetum cinerariifolium TaxID=118510 RepID=A0A699GRY1_TANCI|nr:hypothetical protein [Tanacetum cinerariifolium]